MKLYFKKGVVVGLIVTLCAITIAGVYSYLSMRRLIRESQVQSHGLQVVNASERVLISIIDIETGQRGFVLTGDSSFLEPYFIARKSIDADLNILKELTDDFPAQMQLIERLESTTRTKLEIVASTMVVRNLNFDSARSMVASKRGKIVMDSVRSLIYSIQQNEKMSSDAARDSSDIQMTSYQYAFTGFMALLVIVIGVLFYAINVTLTQREREAAKVKKANQEVMQLNRDLESFTYSVSHDLRAPLRSINGYATVLIEDYGPQLDDEARQVIDVIARNGKRMGQLIDDLLDFSRLGRKELQKTRIPMNEMVNNIVEELRESGSPGSHASLQVDDLPQAFGDLNMMKQVWTNLISNAFKYSAKKEHPQVHIGYTTSQGVKCYYIKDNGVGFDMQYVGKLFGVFQRLHKMGEYEGTGVGLALAKRIIDRHGGSIWGEGVPGEGATFYLTIPER